jgi:Flp pilus assembly protein TadG
MNARRITSLANRRRGATAVEMAVVAPLFFLFAFALIEFGRIGLVKQALTDAARAGCRKAVLANTLNQQDVDTTVRDHLQAVLSDPTQVGKCQVTISHADLSDVQRGTEITTTVQVNCSDISWIAPRYSENVMIRAESTMKRE